MKRLLFIVILASTGAAAQTRDIRHVDLRNHTYNILCGDADTHSRLRVIDGHFDGMKVDFEVHLNLYNVLYGDLTGDGKEEAVVLYMCGSGASYAFFRGLLFGMRQGKPKLLAEIAGGNKGDGGFDSVHIRNRKLIVKREQVGVGGSPCCPEFFETSIYRWRAGRLRLVRKPMITKIPAR